MKKPTVQDIFHSFYLKYLEKYTPSPIQAKAARDIMNCKTGAYGSNVSICADCGHTHIHHNSCRNRCCPMCQAVTYKCQYKFVQKFQNKNVQTL